MVKKIYKKLTDEQRKNNIIFSSCLSTSRNELENDIIHEVKANDGDKWETIKRLLDDSFFNKSSFKHNIIRQ